MHGRAIHDHGNRIDGCFPDGCDCDGDAQSAGQVRDCER